MVAFAQQGIETCFFFSGLYSDYHGVDDESDRIDFTAMKNRISIIYEFIQLLDTIN